MNQTIKPLQDRILLKGITFKDTSISGIVLADTASKEMPQKGRVLAVGPGKQDAQGVLHPISVEVGNVVLFSKYAPDEIKVDDEDYIIIKEEQILAVLDN